MCQKWQSLNCMENDEALTELTPDASTLVCPFALLTASNVVCKGLRSRTGGLYRWHGHRTARRCSCASIECEL